MFGRSSYSVQSSCQLITTSRSRWATSVPSSASNAQETVSSTQPAHWT